MEILNISYNGITSVVLADITRLLESTQIKTMNLDGNHDVFDDEDTTQHFVSILHKNATIQELEMPDDVPGELRTAVDITCARNRQLNRVNLLLAPPPHTPPPPPRNAGTMMLKIWHKAITKFAMVPNNAGASAIFKLFQACPQLLEKHIKRPEADDATGSSRQQDSSSHDDDGNDSNKGGTITTTIGTI